MSVVSAWNNRKLPQLAKIQYGYPFDSNLFNSTEGMPLIRIRDLKRGTSTEALYSGSYEKDYVVNRGDILIGMDGEFRAYKWNGEAALLNQRVCRIWKFAAEVEPNFVFYQLDQHLKRIEDTTPFATVKHLSAKQLKEVSIAYPDLETQRRIVARIQDCFSRLEEMEQLQGKALNQAEALVRRAIDQIWGEPDVASAPLASLCKVANVTTGNTPSRKVPAFFSDDGVPWITPGDMNSAKLISSVRERLSKLGVTEGRARVVPAKSIIVCCIGATIGKVAMVEEATGLNQQLNAVTFGHDVLPDYGYWACRALYPQIISNAAQSTLPILSKGKFEELEIPVPPKSVQKRISETLDRVQIASLEMASESKEILKSYPHLRAAILREAFAGRL